MEHESDVQRRLKQWLEGEGYTVEFRCALAFRKQHFRVQQGFYVRTSGQTTREVDVLAHYTDTENQLRVHHVLECKWSGDKPWVIFSSETASMAASACANQTIGSLLGRSIAWILAGDRTVTDMSMFSSPNRAGFNGRQAFSKGNDVFYTAIKSVVSKAMAIAGEYDDHGHFPERLPEWGVLAFPVVVVKGGVFEAYVNPQSAEICLEEVSHIRVHWQGSDEWRLRASVDVVSDEHIEAFAATRAKESGYLLAKMSAASQNIRDCWTSKSLKDLRFERAPRGTQGLPHVLSAILMREREQECSTPQLSSPEDAGNCSIDGNDN